MVGNIFSGGSRDVEDVRPLSPIIFIFIQFLIKIIQNNRLAPLWVGAPSEKSWVLIPNLPRKLDSGHIQVIWAFVNIILKYLHLIQLHQILCV